MRITKSLQQKIEDLLLACGIRVRYEKGNFRGGFCHLQEEQLVVINKFFPFESRVNLLIDLTAQLPLATDELNDEQRKLLDQLRQEAQRRAQGNLFSAIAQASAKPEAKDGVEVVAEAASQPADVSLN